MEFSILRIRVADARFPCLAAASAAAAAAAVAAVAVNLHDDVHDQQVECHFRIHCYILLLDFDRLQ